MKKVLGIISIGLILFSCTPQTTPQSSAPPGKNVEEKNVGYGSMSNDEITNSVASVETQNEGQELADYLRRVPGISVMGQGDNTRVRIRGAVSNNPGMPQGPLFVINNVPISTYYADVARMVDLNDIKNVDVLKDIGSTTIYGSRGKDGVIIINLKKTEMEEDEDKKEDNKEKSKKKDS